MYVFIKKVTHFLELYSCQYFVKARKALKYTFVGAGQNSVVLSVGTLLINDPSSSLYCLFY